MPSSRDESFHRRTERLLSTRTVPTLEEAIDRARRYSEDLLWLTPFELKETIRLLADGLETRLNGAPAEARVPDEQPLAVEGPTSAATHSGTVLGLKGRQDYEATLILIDESCWLDQNGRRFNAADYGYASDETHRLDLASLRPLPE
jgi:hypothetical protein